MDPCYDDEGYTVLCARTTVPMSSEPPPVKYVNAFAITFLLGVVLWLMWVEWMTRPKTGRRSPSRFLKRFTRLWLKWIGLIGFFFLGWHLFFGGPLNEARRWVQRLRPGK